MTVREIKAGIGLQDNYDVCFRRWLHLQGVFLLSLQRYVSLDAQEQCTGLS